MPPHRAERFEPVTLAHIRSHGCRDLLIYCDSGRYHHSATMNADWLPDEPPVRSLCRMVCTVSDGIRFSEHLDGDGVTISRG